MNCGHNKYNILFVDKFPIIIFDIEIVLDIDD